MLWWRQAWGPIIRPIARAPAQIRTGRNTIRFMNTLVTDWEKTKVRKQKRSKILISLLALMPVISFGLGCWQVKRLQWKQELIAKAETQLSRPPLDLPAKLNVDAVPDFDYRRVNIEGEWVHEQEMLVGPRKYEGHMGYYVVTPLKRADGSKVLICRGWISEEHKLKSSRPQSLENGKVKVVCLMRTSPVPGMFSSIGDPARGDYHFMAIDIMAEATGSIHCYFQQLLNTDSGTMPEQLAMHGIPIGFPSTIEFRNTHFQYIMTWFSLALITAGMLYVTVKRTSKTGVRDHLKRKVQHARNWQ